MVRGLDSHGYIANPCGVDRIQSEFKSLVEHALKCLQAIFADQLHSVYLYGSIARGDAIVRRSDLDISLILHQPLSNNLLQQLAQLAEDLTEQHSTISKVDFDPGYLEEVLAIKEEYRWQFWLKHCCCCLWGEDLSIRFRTHKPSRQIAWQLNDDLATVLESSRQQLQNFEGKACAQMMAKKLLRSAYYLVAKHDNSWLSDLDGMAKVLYRYYPDHVTSIKLSLRLSQGESVNVACINELIPSFGYKVVKQIEKAKSETTNWR